ncbi:hypothetical protein [Nocardioides lijunqiniae]|nr:hypothetical protein [Nocardioides lijunqiniae]
MRTETEHELNPLMPGLWEIALAVLTLGVLVALLVVLAVALTRLMRH